MRDARLANLEWRDLVRVSRLEVAHELLLCTPWLSASCWLAHRGEWAGALALSFVFFLCGLRLAHNAFHHAVGLPRRGDHVVLFALSIAMLGSMHAVRFNHLRHHRMCLEEEDVEGFAARLCWWRALLLGPRFPWRMHQAALSRGSRSVRGWVTAELASNLALGVLAFGVFELRWLQYHLLAMAAGQCLAGFFAVWTVHHGCDSRVARTVRGRFRSLLTFNMFYHLEHHLYPAVPTCHLPALVRRLDAEAPELGRMRVF